MKFNFLCILLLIIVESITVLTPEGSCSTLGRSSVWNFGYIESLRSNFYWGHCIIKKKKKKLIFNFFRIIDLDFER